MIRVQVRGQMLHLWYGGPDPDAGAFLACAPIALADLQRSAWWPARAVPTGARTRQVPVLACAPSRLTQEDWPRSQILQTLAVVPPKATRQAFLR
jgi:hypothetical protein